MRAIRVTRTGGPEVLTEVEVETPTPGPGQVLVRIEAAGVNFVETYQRSGLYPMALPYTPGSEGAGVVTALGAEVTGVALGDRVASTNFAGSYAEYALAPADRLVPVPAGVPTELAAAVLLQGMTAHFLVNACYPVQPDDTVLVHAAAGGVGQLLTQLAVAKGGKVIATVSTPAKAELAQAAGASNVIGYDGFAAVVRELTDGAGVAAVYDGIGRTTFDESLASLRIRGIVVLYGYASGMVAPFDLNRLQVSGSASVTRPTLGHFVATADELTERSADILGRVGAGSLSVLVHERYPLAAAGRAHADLASRGTTGKLLLVP